MGRSFEDEWGPTSAALHRILSRRGVGPWLRDDVVQETGVRLLRVWPTVDEARPVLPLAATIAFNLVKDHCRADARRKIEQLPLDQPDVRDVEEWALSRVELARVADALGQLSEAQRSAVLGNGEARHDGERSRAALKMLRMRGRRKLRAIVDKASGFIGLGTLWRKINVSSQIVASRTGNADGNALAASVATGALLAANIVAIGFVVGPVVSGGPAAAAPRVRPLGPAQAVEVVYRAALREVDDGRESVESARRPVERHADWSWAAPDPTPGDQGWRIEALGTAAGDSEEGSGRVNVVCIDDPTDPHVGGASNACNGDILKVEIRPAPLGLALQPSREPAEE